MIDALAEIPSPTCRRLAAALESGLLAPPYSMASVHSTIGTRNATVLAVLREWERMGVPGPAAAAWLRSLERAKSTIAQPTFVWTGPEAVGLHSRDTRQVYDELITNFKRSIVISTFAYFDGRERFKELAARLDRDSDLRVTLLLNIQRGRHSTTKASDLVRRFASRFWESDWPGQACPDVFYDPRSLDQDAKGVLHAKAVIADNEAIFITSANLTEAALDWNIEVGVLLRDRTLALTASKHFMALIDQERLMPLPQA